ncbi:hypothetical protein [Mammaliicoccus stepanovicii]|uniref:Uncharacterized protein n=1 Tax=Mammaliicoccus stepanovicii TaxID=643214 RepID=A0A239YEQ7_9STAP|nr:hypothetical protein [Mammaliicoccus stepanovicii]PNZ75807.1 hypothetical protein CD111_06185 [Mammaliicoccus stepanovicii]GGI42665.1 hypothetical protein GCM10010896_19550 [Mammaliicoccus stepanovicii]SNV56886.1 Uncharacterised protein [Mammaliicoccus stepanovicii]
MNKKLFVELADTYAFTTQGKGGVTRRVVLDVQDDVKVMDVMDDLHERYNESLNSPDDLLNSVYIHAWLHKEKHKQCLTILKHNSNAVNASICRMNEICLYLGEKFRDVTTLAK